MFTSQTYIMNIFWKISLFWKPKNPLMISQNWIGWWFGAARQQDITCAAADNDLCVTKPQWVKAIKINQACVLSRLLFSLLKRFLNLFAIFPVKNNSALVQTVARRREGGKPLSRPIMVQSTDIYGRQSASTNSPCCGIHIQWIHACRVWPNIYLYVWLCPHGLSYDVYMYIVLAEFRDIKLQICQVTVLPCCVGRIVYGRIYAYKCVGTSTSVMFKHLNLLLLCGTRGVWPYICLFMCG